MEKVGKKNQLFFTAFVMLGTNIEVADFKQI